MDTLDRTFWQAFEKDLASLTPLVNGLLQKGDWAAEDLYSSADGLELVKATWTLFGLRDRLLAATRVSTEDRIALCAFLMGRPEWTPSVTSASQETVPPAEGSERFTDEDEVREKLADSIANLIEVRSRIEAGTFRSPRELASLDNELASAVELLRLITRDVRHQEHSQGRQPSPTIGEPAAS